MGRRKTIHCGGQLAVLLAAASVIAACDRLWPYEPPPQPDQASEASLGDASALEASAADANAPDASTADARPPDSTIKPDVVPARCTIGGTTYEAGDGNPEDSCRVCDPRVSTITWSPAAGCIITLAGEGSGHVDGVLSAARFNRPHHVAVDDAGQIYVSEEYGRRIRLIDAGQVTTLAGTGVQGYLDKSGAEARFDTPFGLALDGKSALYLADAGNHRIRKLALETNEVTTFAGGASCSYAETGLCDPRDVALNTRTAELYVADCGGNCIHKISNGQVSRFAGACSALTGSADDTLDQARFNCPAALLFVPGAVAAEDVLYVAERDGQRIRKIVNGAVSTLAGSGSAGSVDELGTQAQFNEPYGLALASESTLVVADAYNSTIRTVALANGKVGSLLAARTIALQGFADGRLDTAKLWGPCGVAAWHGVVYVADELNHRIRVLRLP